MRFLVSGSLPQALAHGLQPLVRPHEVVSEIDHLGSDHQWVTDKEILRLCRTEKFVLLTRYQSSQTKLTEQRIYKSARTNVVILPLAFNLHHIRRQAAFLLFGWDTMAEVIRVNGTCALEMPSRHATNPTNWLRI